MTEGSSFVSNLESLGFEQQDWGIYWTNITLSNIKPSGDGILYKKHNGIYYFANQADKQELQISDNRDLEGIENLAVYDVSGDSFQFISVSEAADSIMAHFQDGSTIWEESIDELSAFSIARDDLVVAGTAEGTLIGLDMELNGIEDFQFTLPSEDPVNEIQADESTILVSTETELTSIDTNSQETKYTTSFESEIQSIAKVGELAVITNTNGITGLSESGDVVFEKPISAERISSTKNFGHFSAENKLGIVTSAGDCKIILEDLPGQILQTNLDSTILHDDGSEIRILNRESTDESFSTNVVETDEKIILEIKNDSNTVIENPISVEPTDALVTEGKFDQFDIHGLVPGESRDFSVYEIDGEEIISFYYDEEIIKEITIGHTESIDTEHILEEFEKAVENTSQSPIEQSQTKTESGSKNSANRNDPDHDVTTGGSPPRKMETNTGVSNEVQQNSQASTRDESNESKTDDTTGRDQADQTSRELPDIENENKRESIDSKTATDSTKPSDDNLDSKSINDSSLGEEQSSAESTETDSIGNSHENNTSGTTENETERTSIFHGKLENDTGNKQNIDKRSDNSSTKHPTGSNTFEPDEIASPDELEVDISGGHMGPDIIVKNPSGDFIKAPVKLIVYETEDEFKLNISVDDQPLDAVTIDKNTEDTDGGTTNKEGEENDKVDSLEEPDTSKPTTNHQKPSQYDTSENKSRSASTDSLSNKSSEKASLDLATNESDTIPSSNDNPNHRNDEFDEDFQQFKQEEDSIAKRVFGKYEFNWDIPTQKDVTHCTNNPIDIKEKEVLIEKLTIKLDDRFDKLVIHPIWKREEPYILESNSTTWENNDEITLATSFSFNYNVSETKEIPERRISFDNNTISSDKNWVINYKTFDKDKSVPDLYILQTEKDEENKLFIETKSETSTILDISRAKWSENNYGKISDYWKDIGNIDINQFPINLDNDESGGLSDLSKSGIHYKIKMKDLRQVGYTPKQLNTVVPIMTENISNSKELPNVIVDGLNLEKGSIDFDE